MDPTTFRNGDIVEAQVSFVGVPLRGDKVKFMIVLRALALLDREQSMVGTVCFKFLPVLTMCSMLIGGKCHESQTVCRPYPPETSFEEESQLW